MKVNNGTKKWSFVSLVLGVIWMATVMLTSFITKASSTMNIVNAVPKLENRIGKIEERQNQFELSTERRLIRIEEKLDLLLKR